MRLVIVAPHGVLRRTQVGQVSLPGEMGAFTVLKGHAPLIAHLTAGDIVYVPEDGAEERLAVTGGFVRVYKDEIEVCAEIPDEKQ